MKTRIPIKSIFGKILFEFKKENNSIKETLIEAIKIGANLRGANLRGADLRDANLRDAYLGGADLRGAYLRGTDLGGADLRGADLGGANLGGADLGYANLRGADLGDANLIGANLIGADLRGANLRGAYLKGAYLRDVKIKKIAIFTGLYKYVVIAYITNKNEKRIQLGCYDRSLKEWDNDFWNNINEFPDNKSEKSKLRLFAFETAKKWFEIIDNE